MTGYQKLKIENQILWKHLKAAIEAIAEQNNPCGKWREEAEKNIAFTKYLIEEAKNEKEQTKN